MATITVIELNHNQLTEIERDPAGFAFAVVRRLEAGNGPADVPGGRVVFTSHSSEDKGRLWRDFERETLSKL